MHVECDLDMRRVVIGLGEHRHICDYDGQVVQIPGTEADFLECPRRATICPHMYSCPASCSGRGVCDLGAFPYPKCRCINPEDTSEGCYADGSSSGEEKNIGGLSPEDAQEGLLWFDSSSNSRHRTPLFPLFGVVLSVLYYY